MMKWVSLCMVVGMLASVASAVPWGAGSARQTKTMRNSGMHLVEGTPVDNERGDFRYTVALWDVSGSEPLRICSGALIEEDVVVTSSRCWWYFSLEGDVRVCIGNNDNEMGVCSEIDSFRVPMGVAMKHQDFQGTADHDVALVTLKTPFQGQGIEPATISFEKPSADKKAFTIGHGVVEEEDIEDSTSGKKLAAGASTRFFSSVKIVDAENCGLIVGAEEEKDGYVCGISDLNPRGKACLGDMGGPLVLSSPRGSGKPDEIVGVLSFGYNTKHGECKPNTETAFTALHEEHVKQFIVNELELMKKNRR